MKYKSIAIDGPSGAGKSTLARLLAGHFGFVYVDTGAIYRSVGLFALRNKVQSKDEEGVVALLPQIKIEMKHDESGAQRMFLNGEDVSAEIRMPQVSIYASDVSAMPPVRKFLLAMQREMARRANVIMDGRDIGTVVLPEADLKIFLTATDEDRAQRRYLELCEKKVNTTFEEVLKDIRYRDKNDASRAVAPLKPAEDAVLLDTTGNTLEQSFALLKSVVEDKLHL